ncbi:MAG TPA: 50S ribosomal protein L21 [Candidatus Stercoripulliclostridium merdipullorum]|uniref:Large ribosomal subunit protein bL21 n=1 Tax=Candidatus Stercoripulliclostridium merdipullorum TaxID=2840952 RepID=A0A9D1NBQ0_9FIRM|nr:50S ribosomal protein L21 [Candidatus Stercoripulliclostridium merdipullorum]
MYAIVLTGGKQYKVETGSVLKVELLSEEVGAKVKLPVLFVSDNGVVKAGDAVKDAYATAEVVFSGRGPKIDIFTYKAKKNVRKRQGHRQPYTEIKILEIVG